MRLPSSFAAVLVAAAVVLNVAPAFAASPAPETSAATAKPKAKAQKKPKAPKANRDGSKAKKPAGQQHKPRKAVARLRPSATKR